MYSQNEIIGELNALAGKLSKEAPNFVPAFFDRFGKKLNAKWKASYGWTLLKQGQVRRSVEILSGSVEADPGESKMARRLAHAVTRLLREQPPEKPQKKKKIERETIGAVTQFLQNATDFKPNTIIDVGVNTGTPGLYGIYPNVHYLLADPIEENEVFMKKICGEYIPSNYFVAAMGAKKGEMVLSVDPTFGGSRLKETVGAHKHGMERVVEVDTIDNIVEATNAKAPFLIKIDTEGAEHFVLEGAKKTLEKTEVLILETRVWASGKAPELLETLRYLDELNFLAYDIIDKNYHDVAGFLKQFDLIAVKRDGIFRNKSSYKGFENNAKGNKSLEEIIAAKTRKREKLLKQLQAH